MRKQQVFCILRYRSYNYSIYNRCCFFVYVGVRVYRKIHIHFLLNCFSKMLPYRRLLYHRDIDDSVGTYATDYLLFAVCFILTSYLIWLIAKYRCTGRQKSGVAKSTYGVLLFTSLVGIAALVGGLVHQFLQEEDNYITWTDNIAWLIVWRLASVTSAGVCFAFFILTEQLLSLDEIWRLNRVGYISYYVIASLLCLGVAAYNIAVFFNKKNPWDLSISFAVVFLCALMEMVTALVVLCKRFNGSKDALETTCTEITNITSSSNSFAEDRKTKADTYKRNSLVGVNSTRTVKRWDLFLHFSGPVIFLFAGAIQFVLGSVFQCGKHQDSPFIHCPLPDEFNHNSILHLLHAVAVVVMCVAETLAIRRRWNQKNCHILDETRLI